MLPLSFEAPLLEGLYELDSPPKARLSCTATVRRHYVKVLNKLRCMSSRASFPLYRALDCKVLDPKRPLFSVEVTAGYRLEFSCREQDGRLVALTVCSLRFPAA